MKNMTIQKGYEKIIGYLVEEEFEKALDVLKELSKEHELVEISFEGGMIIYKLHENPMYARYSKEVLMERYSKLMEMFKKVNKSK